MSRSYEMSVRVSEYDPAKVSQTKTVKVTKGTSIQFWHSGV